MTIEQMLDTADVTDGEVIHTAEYTTEGGSTVTEETNLSALLTPGPRRTGKIDLLVHEAEKEHVENPARPVDVDTANEAIQRILDDGNEPAWKNRKPAQHPRVAELEAGDE